MMINEINGYFSSLKVTHDLGIAANSLPSVFICKLIIIIFDLVQYLSLSITYSLKSLSFTVSFTFRYFKLEI